ncbi:leucine-rich repeat extensin-like protein 5 [Hibiscus syriacus]|uniref:leucine-rich repeat extensin-like protein 5 n=1 Tax=Hibiscus syriacus TaxID=106335 RepID=UPI0019237125|nr:leucine-rich repeat extensin-like protein 5 [Hibiscus syriacus]
MASFWFPISIMYFIASSPLPSSASYSSDSRLSSNTTTISASSVSMSDPPLSPFQPLSPDIAPLLPSPGGLVPTTGTSMPTIPSTPSPPNPDDFIVPGPDSAFPPFGALPASSSSPRLSSRSLHLAATFPVLVVVPYCLMLLVMVL